ncbi:zinc-dependent metalloprotease [Singulisphaera sp. Ch08]|uniref:Zinc-dependent metalloprotease n=1 Tax=Singulisphaera sp. Ch08 TaxID=3120278 RepID=A0AAU7CIX7_9BACT
MRHLIALGWATTLVIVLGSTSLWAEEDKKPEGKAPDAAAGKDKAEHGRGAEGEKKFRDFNEVTKDSEKFDGLFTLHRKDEHLYAEIKADQFEKPLLVPINIARGMAMAGEPLNFGDQWVLVFKRVGDKVHLIRRNVHYKAPTGSAVERAVQQNYLDSVLLALPIISINHANNNAVVIDLADVFLTDFAQLQFFGSLDRNRTTWHKIKTYPNNLEIEVEATYSGGPYSFAFFDNAAADRRGKTLIIHYSLVKAPDGGYKPRYADDRVGHFLDAAKDFGKADLDTYFVRQVNRWRLEKVDPKAKLSPPKKQIIWYIEATVPEKYRPAVEEGILEWNKAFQKIGFKNAIAVRWQTEGRDDFDPEDINYCTFRWGTADGAGAYSGLRSNPLTGEMIDGDVVFDDGLVRYWAQEYAFMTGTAPTAAGDRADAPLAMGEVISPIMAAKMGFGLPLPLIGPRSSADGLAPGVEAVPAGTSADLLRLRRQMLTGQFAACQFTTGLRRELAMAALTFSAAGTSGPDEKLSEEALSQLIKYVVMHEVGHSLGLRHNFHGSTMLTADEINDPAITRVKGQSGSVMDYNPLNIASKGKKQGDFATTTIGPYDYWAIEYAYKPIDGDEAAELRKIAARSPDPDLVYSTDEDMFLDHDPLVNAFDLGSDPTRYARDRVALAAELMKGLDEKVVKEGEPWSRTRRAFSLLLSQWGDAAYLASSHVGGQYVSRDHRPGESKEDKDKERKEKDKAESKADKNEKEAKAETPQRPTHDPITPVPGTKQREALKLVSEQILSDRAFQFSPALLRKLASERWYHWGNERLFYYGGSVEFPIYQHILGIQKIVLGQCLSANTLSRLQNQELQAEPKTESLTMAEVFRSLTDGIWSECEPNDARGGAVACSTIRRNLQREHLKKLSTLVLGRKRSPYEDLFDYIFFFGTPEPPADAKSLARLHMEEIRDRIGKFLDPKDSKVDETTRAHLKECRTRINKVLDASLDLNEP